MRAGASEEKVRQIEKWADSDLFSDMEKVALEFAETMTITGRKKDIIVTSSGKNLAPGPLEDRLRAHPLISQCLVVGDNRQYVAALITLDPEGLYHWAYMHKMSHLPARRLVAEPLLRQELQRAVDDANLLVSRAESQAALEQRGMLLLRLGARAAAMARSLQASSAQTTATPPSSTTSPNSRILAAK